METITAKPEVSKDAKTQSKTRPDFGKGNFSTIMSEAYDSAMHLFHLESEKAEKYARQLASDLGAIHASVQFDFKAGKPDKDAFRKIALAGKSGKVTVSPALAVAIATRWIDDAGSNYVSWGKTQWTLSPFVQEWIEKL